MRKRSSGGGVFGKVRLGCLVIVILCILVYISLALVQCAKNKSGELPAASEAPYLAQTASRFYVCKDGRVEKPSGTMAFKLLPASYTLGPGELVIMIDWYDSANNRWVLHKGPGPAMSKPAYGEITIKRRQ